MQPTSYTYYTIAPSTMKDLSTATSTSSSFIAFVDSISSSLSPLLASLEYAILAASWVSVLSSYFFRCSARLTSSLPSSYPAVSSATNVFPLACSWVLTLAWVMQITSCCLDLGIFTHIFMWRINTARQDISRCVYYSEGLITHTLWCQAWNRGLHCRELHSPNSLGNEK